CQNISALLYRNRDHIPHPALDEIVIAVHLFHAELLFSGLPIYLSLFFLLFQLPIIIIRV
ncbi:hypothetical protein ABS202_18880, partial [Acinetobacter baumannii]|uniref:hypothetical protein n=1 Tax=Acinetobacter baumannii TaxID=470 RepID=UPI003321C4AF